MSQRTDATGVRRRLGRGLQSLISQPVKIDLSPPAASSTNLADGPVQTVATPAPAHGPGSAGGAPLPTHQPTDRITASPNQPRRTFDDESIARLAESIRQDGLMQPIVVRPKGAGYEVVAGERRWRAARLLHLAAIPAIVRSVDDRTAAEWSLIENLQREDLNPIDRAEAFERLIEAHGLTHQEIAERVGLERSSVSNHLRLNELDDFTKDAVRSGALTMGHGRTLLAIANNAERTALARRAIAGAWSVRELEQRIRARAGHPGAAVGSGAAPPGGLPRRPAHLVDLERRLGAQLGTKVAIRPGRKKGSGVLVISFFSHAEFDGLMERLGVVADDALPR
jgi:ParB family chromosome partitioning protein